MADEASAILDLIQEFLVSKNLINTAAILHQEWAALYGEDPFPEGLARPEPVKTAAAQPSTQNPKQSRKNDDLGPQSSAEAIPQHTSAKPDETKSAGLEEGEIVDDVGSTTSSEDSAFDKTLVDVADIMEDLEIGDDEEDVTSQDIQYQDDEEDLEEEEDEEVQRDEEDEEDLDGDEEEDETEESKEDEVNEEHTHLASRSPSPTLETRSDSALTDINDLIVQHIQLQRDEFYQEDAAADDNKLDSPATDSADSGTTNSPAVNQGTTGSSVVGPSTTKETTQPKEFAYPILIDGVTFDTFDLKIVHIKDRTGFEPTKDFPIKVDSIVAGRYQILEFLDAAAFSKAIRALDLHTGNEVCMKIIKNNKEFVDQSLDEIKLLRYLNSVGDADQNNILRLYDFFYFKEHLFIVSELLRDNLYEFYKYNLDQGHPPYFTLPRLQRVAKQCLAALRFIHGLDIIHTDLKPENILIKSYSRCEVKIIDFGSSCFTKDHLGVYVQSRAYRAPEVILGLPYTAKIDVWSLGCIIAELFTSKVLFVNTNLATLLARVLALLGPFPPEMLSKGKFVSNFFTRSWKLFEHDKKTDQYYYLQPKPTSLKDWLKSDDPEFVDFVSMLLAVRPSERPTADEALRHPWLSKAYDLEPYNALTSNTTTTTTTTTTPASTNV